MFLPLWWVICYRCRQRRPLCWMLAARMTWRCPCIARRWQVRRFKIVSGSYRRVCVGFSADTAFVRVACTADNAVSVETIVSCSTCSIQAIDCARVSQSTQLHFTVILVAIFPTHSGNKAVRRAVPPFALIPVNHSTSARPFHPYQPPFNIKFLVCHK